MNTTMRQVRIAADCRTSRESATARHRMLWRFYPGRIRTGNPLSDSQALGPPLLQQRRAHSMPMARTARFELTFPGCTPGVLDR
jgi:hypothetical protein